MTAITFFLGGIALLIATSLLAVVLNGTRGATRAVYTASMAISLAALVGAGGLLVSGAPIASSITLPLGLPWTRTHFSLDGLSLFFLVVVNLGGTLSSLYGIGYGRHEQEPGRVLPFFTAFLAGMNMVVLADDAFTFLISWEFMSLTSWALVVSQHRNEDATRAGYIYLVMASFGTLALMLAFVLLAGPQGQFTFAAMRHVQHGPLIVASVLTLMLLGAGSKAGMVPLHVWLPLAHPAAPSHVSALMSGVMTKVAIYGFIRVMFDLLGPAQWWTGLVVLVLAAATAVMGVLYALMQHDLKKLLAYHTVENIGIIFIGLGLALAFNANGMTVAAALAMTAALFHILNHSLFKSLLFFGAGAVLTATGERDMEKLGGLIHRMPTTAFTFLVASAAISALPPLNGFVSEWLTFQAILQSPHLPQWGLKVIVPGVGAMLALAAALAAACFVKVYGVTFLGRARSEVAEKAQEVDRYMLTAMATLALLCLLAGIFPSVVIDTLAHVTTPLLGMHMPPQAAVGWLTIAPISQVRSTYNGFLVFVFIALSASLAVYFIHHFASRAIRRGPAWGCGFVDVGPTAQYSAVSFAQPIRRVFGTLVFRARERVEMPPPGDTAPARLVVELHDPVWEGIFAPLADLVSYVTLHLNFLQFLTIRRYIGLAFISLVLLLMVLAIWA